MSLCINTRKCLWRSSKRGRHIHYSFFFCSASAVLCPTVSTQITRNRIQRQLKLSRVTNRCSSDSSCCDRNWFGQPFRFGLFWLGAEINELGHCHETINWRLTLNFSSHFSAFSVTRTTDACHESKSESKATQTTLELRKVFASAFISPDVLEQNVT